MQSTHTGHTGIVGKGRMTADRPGPEIMATDTLEGDRVLTTDDEDVGHVKDVMLDVRSGRIAYAVLASGGILGVGQTLRAIPWNALTLDTTRKCFVLSATAERVRNAPGFDKDHWPSMADPQWATPLHEYYGSVPYWTAGEEMDLDAPPNEAYPDGNEPRGPTL